MSIHEIETYYPRSKQHWRRWLTKNHVQKDAVWLIMYKQSAGKPSISWSDAVDEALCFGWIDSIKKKLDEERSIQYFSKRKPKSTWSRVNKEKIEKLIATGQMTPAGLNCVEVAKQNGSWTILDSVERLEIPTDLNTGLKSKSNAFSYFLGLSNSTKKAILQWIVLAKKPETRQKRIKEIVELADKNQKPKQF